MVIKGLRDQETWNLESRKGILEIHKICQNNRGEIILSRPPGNMNTRTCIMVISPLPAIDLLCK